MTLPGIGATSALAIVGVVGDVRRFAGPNKLVSYLGLDPRVHQSGERPAYTGHISRAGQAHARGLLIEAAHAAVDAPGPLRAFFRRVRSRRGAQVAIVAVARKLVVLAWHLLSGECDYRFARASLIAKKRRDLELATGSARRTRGPRRPGPTLKKRREAERTMLEAAEETYRAFVSARGTTADAAATNGARH